MAPSGPTTRASARPLLLLAPAPAPAPAQAPVAVPRLSPHRILCYRVVVGFPPGLSRVLAPPYPRIFFLCDGHTLLLSVFLPYILPLPALLSSPRSAASSSACSHVYSLPSPRTPSAYTCRTGARLLVQSQHCRRCIHESTPFAMTLCDTITRPTPALPTAQEHAPSKDYRQAHPRSAHRLRFSQWMILYGMYPVRGSFPVHTACSRPPPAPVAPFRGISHGAQQYLARPTNPFPRSRIMITARGTGQGLTPCRRRGSAA